MASRAHGRTGREPAWWEAFGGPAGRQSPVSTPVCNDGCVVEGHAGLVGRWLGDRIRVHQESTELTEPRAPGWVVPPCAAPAGDWPCSPDEYPNSDVDLDDLGQIGAAVTATVFRPSPRQAVLVVAAADVATVEERLRPRLLDGLCVVPSRCTRAYVGGTQQHVLDVWQRGVYGCGRSSDERGQGVLTVDLVRVTDEIDGWVDAQLAGLVELKPCLSPVHDRGP